MRGNECADRGTDAMVARGRELWWDVPPYAGSAIVAAGIGTTGTHATQIWGCAAAVGYAGAAIIASGQLLRVRAGYRRVTGATARAVVCGLTWLTAAGLPLLLLVAGRAAGRPRQVRGEVWVVEEAAGRLFELGTPYLTRAAIAGLPPDERLHAYMPYQPGMALFGVPRVLDPAAAWWWVRSCSSSTGRACPFRIWWTRLCTSRIRCPVSRSVRGLLLGPRRRDPGAAVRSSFGGAWTRAVAALAGVGSGPDG